MSDQVHSEPLTERETEILTYLADGLTNSEIASQLYLAPSTVKWYVTQLNRKLDTANRDEIVARANQLHLLESPESPLPPKHNLPHLPTPFIGRTAELSELDRLLADPDVRLLTIIALGGMGKTSLAIEAAHQQLNNFPDGVYFVPLADVEHIALAIAEHTGHQFRQDHEQHPEQQILDYLSNKRLLLVLDNFEHLLEHASLVSAILEAAPGVKLLVTSRERLNLSTETLYALHGLPYPTWETPADARDYDAVKLLVQAARRVKPDWDMTADNLDDVARICRLTEGMPLGILLAASWLDVFSLEHIANEIQTNVDFLETEMRDVSQRQRSIRAVFESSWQCLRAAEQAAFMKLAVFRQGCTLAAAVAITGASPRALQALVNKALLSHTQQDRYELHELLRQYGQERLEQSGFAVETAAAHSAYYCDHLRDLAADLQGRDQLAALETIDHDYWNIYLAWLWAAEHGHVDNFMSGLFSILLYHLVRRPYSESLAVTTRAINYLRDLPVNPARDHTLAHILAVTSRFHSLLWQDDAARRCLDESQQLLQPGGTPRDAAIVTFFRAISSPDSCEAMRFDIEAALEAFQEAGDDWWLAMLHGVWGNTLVWYHDPAAGRQQLEAARAIQEKAGDRFGLANTLLGLGQAADRVQDFAQARSLTLAAMELFREIRAPSGVYQSLKTLGLLAEEVGDFESARKHYEEGLALARESGNQADSMFQSWSLSFVALAQGAYDEAAALCEPAVHYFQTADVTLSGIVLIRAGEIALAQGKLDAAIAFFQQSLQTDEQSHNLLYFAFAQRGLGKAAHRLGHYEPAREHLQTALAALDAYQNQKPLVGSYKSTESATVQAALAELALTKGVVEEAAQQVQAAVSLTIDSPRISITLTVMATAAALLAAQQQFTKAAELVAFVENHPSAYAVDKDRVAALDAQLEAEFGPTAYAQARERGRALDLETAASYVLEG